ncbi:MAG: amidase [Caldilineaceae bacterium]|nr:amidase [Caldilineaceae bacterium]
MKADLSEVTVVQLQDDMAAGARTSAGICEGYLAAIAALDGDLRSVIETNPDALAIAEQMDRERASGRVRGPLHGIPILLKDNIDTDDRMQTTAGSLALLGSRPAGDATVAASLRQAGAVILAKANLSEWANWRSTSSNSGWSARGGQCCNPYDLARSPGGSSSGSGAAVSANLAAVALGTETDGSIVNPSTVCGIAGIKPTVGLSSRAGVIPISHTQDTVGPMARTVADAAAVLGALTAADARDTATGSPQRTVHADYRRFLDADGLRGARIGAARNEVSGFDAATDRVYAEAIAAMRDAGAEVIDPADIPTIEDDRMRASERLVMMTEFKHDIGAYLATRVVVDADMPQPRTLADLIQFNLDHAEQELALFGQEQFERAQESGPIDGEAYLEALTTGQRLAGAEGLDAVLDAYNLDALIAPTGGPPPLIDPQFGETFQGGSSRCAAVAGYPLVTVPAGFVTVGEEGDAGVDLPIGLTFMGRAWSEPVLIRLAYAFERITQARRPPQRFSPAL